MAPPPRSRAEAGLASFDTYYAPLDADADVETENAQHFDGCHFKTSSCHSDRCGSCWSQGFWIPKSQLFFDEEERRWYIDRRWAAAHDVAISEGAFED
jgi:hypothetical protein